MSDDVWVVVEYERTATYERAATQEKIVRVLGVFSPRDIADIYAQSTRVHCRVQRYAIDEPARRLSASLRADLQRIEDWVSVLPVPDVEDE